MTINSREKGKRREREWRDVLRGAGFPARRGQQYRGGEDSPDVICEATPYLSWEVKGAERLDLIAAVDQARQGAGFNQFGVVAHKKSRSPWLCTMHAEDFIQMLGRLNAAEGEATKEG